MRQHATPTAAVPGNVSRAMAAVATTLALFVLPTAAQTDLARASLSPGDLHDPVRAAIAQLPSAEVKRVYLRCASDAGKRRLSSAEIASCSVVYDVLLKQHFAGSYEAVSAWSRAALAAPQD